MKDPRFRVPSAIPSKAEVEVLREDRRNFGSGTARNCPLPVEALELRRLAASMKAAPESDVRIMLERRLCSVLVLSCVLIVEVEHSKLSLHRVKVKVEHSKLSPPQSEGEGGTLQVIFLKGLGNNTNSSEQRLEVEMDYLEVFLAHKRK